MDENKKEYRVREIRGKFYPQKWYKEIKIQHGFIFIKTEIREAGWYDLNIDKHCSCGSIYRPVDGFETLSEARHFIYEYEKGETFHYM